MMGECTKETAFELLDFFCDQGGNFIDTANQYQSGQSEEWIGEWMETRECRDEMVIATKYTHSFRAHEAIQQSNFGGTGSKSMHTSIEASLKKLKTDYIDLVCRKRSHANHTKFADPDSFMSIPGTIPPAFPS